MDTQLSLRKKLVIVLDMSKKQSIDRPTKQVEGAPPIIENTKLPKMTEKRAAPRPKSIRGKILRMPIDPTPDKGGRNRMDPVPTKLTTIIEATNHEYPPQEESKGRKKSS
jgi:hypothetical protein